MSQGVTGCCAVGAQPTGAAHIKLRLLPFYVLSVPLITANFIKSGYASCTQMTKSVSVKEIHEVECFSGAIWVAGAAGKCHTLSPLGFGWEQGEVPAWGCLTLARTLGARMLN